MLEGGSGGDHDIRPVAVLVVAGDPDAATLAPVHAALTRSAVFRVTLLYTREDDAGLRESLGLPPPDRTLRVPAASHAVQIASALASAEEVLQELRPAVVVVTGAADTALGTALAAAKLGIAVARVDAGLRARDWGEPAEVNRVLLDAMADSLFIASEYEAATLEQEGAGAGRVHLVGSTIADEMRRAERLAHGLDAWRRHELGRGSYVLVLLRHAARCGDDERLARMVEALALLARRTRVVLPMSAHLRERLESMGDVHRLEAAGVLLLPPQGYLDVVSLQLGAGAIVTDSSIVQEVTSALGVRCFTVGEATDRAITVSHGTNVLLGGDAAEIAEVSPSAALPVRCAIPMWDGRASRRIAEALAANYALVRAS